MPSQKDLFSDLSYPTDLQTDTHAPIWFKKTTHKHTHTHHHHRTKAPVMIVTWFVFEKRFIVRGDSIVSEASVQYGYNCSFRRPAVNVDLSFVLSQAK